MLDMCLYDGFNGNAISYEIMLKDEGRPAAGRRDGYFSIYRQGGTTTDEGELILLPGQNVQPGNRWAN